MRAPSVWARESAARTNGVVPLAAMPTTTSLAPTWRASISPRPALTSSSAPSIDLISAGQSAGDDAHHHLGRRAEGRRALGGVEHAEPAAGAGADVEQPAARAERSLDQVDGAGDVRARAGDRGGHGGVFGADEIHDLERGRGVDGRRCGGCAARSGAGRGSRQARLN